MLTASHAQNTLSVNCNGFLLRISQLSAQESRRGTHTIQKELFLISWLFLLFFFFSKICSSDTRGLLTLTLLIVSSSMTFILCVVIVSPLNDLWGQQYALGALGLSLYPM